MKLNWTAKQRLGVSLPLVLFGFVTVAFLGIGGYYLFVNRSDADFIDPIPATVTKGDFVSQVLSEGEVQSSENVEIKCEVRSRNGSVSVLKVVPEGTKVKAGDFLVELDSTAFEKELEQQKIAVTNAETQKIRAKTDSETALVSLEEYEKGIFEESKTKLEMDLIAAQQELELSEETFRYSKLMQAKSFITKQQLDGEQLSVEQAKRRIDLVQKQLEILNLFSKKRELIRLKSDIQATEVKERNDEEAYKVEVTKLEEIEDLIAKCTVNVPAGVSGQVVHNKEFDRRGGSEWVLEPGAEVREGQVLIRLPNPDEMEVKALIQEQSITSIKVGFSAEVRVNALNNRVLIGIVTKVNQYAEPGGWMSGSARKYAVIVKILNPPVELIPGMKSSVVIQTRFDNDKTQVPVQAVYGVQGRYFCLVQNGKTFDSVEVELDGDNSTTAVVKSGLEPNQEVILNPGAYRELLVLPEILLDQPIAMTPEEQALADQAQAAAAKAGGSGGPSGAAGGMVAGTLAKYDSNSDGTISKDELESLDEKVKGFITRADKNKDGDVTTEELTTAMAAMSQGGGGRPGGRGAGGGGARGGGPNAESAASETTQQKPETTTGATQDGATQDGATQDGATQDGATQDGATQDGATQDGAATNKATTEHAE